MSSIPRVPGPSSIALLLYLNFRSQRRPLEQPSSSSLFSLPKNRLFRFKVPTFFKRALRPPALDFDKLIWEIVYLVILPKKVYKSLYYHKYTKNHYHRDDPAFILLISFFLVISAIAWGITYGMGFGGILKLIVYMVGVDFYLVGIIVASVNWVLVNKFLRRGGGGILGGLPTAPASISTLENIPIIRKVFYLFTKLGNFFSSNNVNVASLSGEESLEWAYCFDIHCNSFLVIWLNLYLIQFICLPILTMNNFFSRFLGNSLYLVTFCYYCVNSFYGYNILPFLMKTELILMPVPVFVILWLVFTLGGINITSVMVDQYFN